MRAISLPRESPLRAVLKTPGARPSTLLFPMAFEQMQHANIGHRRVARLNSDPCLSIKKSWSATSTINLHLIVVDRWRQVFPAALR